MDTNELKQFLIDSNAAGYAVGDEKNWTKEPDGSTTIQFEKGDWKSHDNFFGGEPYGGRLVVFHKGKPHWIMVYYGWVKEGVETNTVYQVLRGALKEMPAESPFRGPKVYTEGEFRYTNTWSGEVGEYNGEEKIMQGDTVIYTATYLGGLVDQRQGV